MTYKFQEKVSNFKDNLFKVAKDMGIPPEAISKEAYLEECGKLGLKTTNITEKHNYDALRDSVSKHVRETLYTKSGTTSPLRERKFLDKVETDVYGNTMIQKMAEKKGNVFTASDVTKDRLCGFTAVEPVRRILDKLVESGIIKKGNHKCSYVIGDEPTEDKETFNENDLGYDYREQLAEEIKKYSRFVVTTAVVNKAVNMNFLNSIKNYAERNNALVLILPSDIASKKKKDDKGVMELDSRLKDFRVIYKDTYLNENLCLCAVKVSAKQINPLTGLQRMATKKQASIVIGSTKMLEENVACKKGGIPLRVAATGAITINNYDTDEYMSMKRAYVAEEDHMYGAAVIEIEDKKIFHLRLVEGSEEGTFTDLGVEYLPDGSTKELKNNVFVMGDSHTEQIDELLHRKIMEFVDKMSVSNLILHDCFNSTSATHHDKGKNLTRALKAMEGRLSIMDEGENLKRYIEVLRTHVPNITIVRSNHDRHLDTYLEEGRFMKDPINTYAGLKLSSAYLEGLNPLQYLLEDMLGLSKTGVTWLKQDESFMFKGIELGMHGDKGANGSRGSLVTFERSVGNCVTGHTHAGKRLRRACCVGTVANLDQGYNEGLTSWSRTCCICYSNGTKQLVHFIPNKKGKYSYGTIIR